MRTATSRLLALTALLATSATALAGTILVPLQEPTVADALEMTRPGDTVVVVANAPGGGRARAANGVRIVGTPGSVVRGDLHVVGRRVRLHRLQFRDGHLRVTGPHALIRHCTMDGVDARGISIRGRRARVIGGEVHVSRPVSAVEIDGDHGVVRDVRIRMGRHLVGPRFGTPGTTGINVRGRRTRLRDNLVSGAESAVVVAGDLARIEGDTVFSATTGMRVTGDRVIVNGTSVNVERSGIVVGGLAPRVTANRATAQDHGGGAGPGFVIRSSGAAAVVTNNSVSGLSAGFDLELSGADIRELSHTAYDDGGFAPSFRVTGDDNTIESLSSNVTYSGALELNGSGNLLSRLIAFGGSLSFIPGIRVIGDANVIHDVSLSGRSQFGVSFYGNGNVLSESDVEVNIGIGVRIAGDQNIVRDTAARCLRGTGSAALFVANGNGNVVERSTVTSRDEDVVGLHNAASATVVRDCTIRSGGDFDGAPQGEHVRNDGDFAEFEGNVVGPAE